MVKSIGHAERQEIRGHLDFDCLKCTLIMTCGNVDRCHPTYEHPRI